MTLVPPASIPHGRGITGSRCLVIFHLLRLSSSYPFSTGLPVSGLWRSVWHLLAISLQTLDWSSIKYRHHLTWESNHSLLVKLLSSENVHYDFPHEIVPKRRAFQRIPVNLGWLWTWYRSFVLLKSSALTSRATITTRTINIYYLEIWLQRYFFLQSPKNTTQCLASRTHMVKNDHCHKSFDRLVLQSAM